MIIPWLTRAARAVAAVTAAARTAPAVREAGAAARRAAVPAHEGSRPLGFNGVVVVSLTTTPSYL